MLKSVSKFYAENEPNIAQYFRVLYQIFRLISHSGLNEEDKVKYENSTVLSCPKMKCSLYYNANTIYGSKFREYINEFNITKHLSILDKLEFKNIVVTTYRYRKSSVTCSFLKYEKRTERMY